MKISLDRLTWGLNWWGGGGLTENIQTFILLNNVFFWKKNKTFFVHINSQPVLLKMVEKVSTFSFVPGTIYE